MTPVADTHEQTQWWQTETNAHTQTQTHTHKHTHTHTLTFLSSNPYLLTVSSTNVELQCERVQKQRLTRAARHDRAAVHVLALSPWHKLLEGFGKD